MKGTLGSKKTEVRGVEERQEPGVRVADQAGVWRVSGEEYLFSPWLFSPNSCFLLITASIMQELVKAAIVFTKSSVDPSIFAL